MTPQAEAALRRTIENKWEKIVDCEESDRGMANCELCQLFNHKHLCRGCPVARHTGEDSCYDTPYHDFRIYVSRAEPAHLISSDGYRVFDQKSYNFALAELEFLKSLLPDKTDTTDTESDTDANNTTSLNPRTVITDETPTR
jgi:hypothetical protein